MTEVTGSLVAPGPDGGKKPIDDELLKLAAELKETLAQVLMETILAALESYLSEFIDNYEFGDTINNYLEENITNIFNNYYSGGTIPLKMCNGGGIVLLSRG